MPLIDPGSVPGKLLLLRKSLSYYIFIISLLAVMITVVSSLCTGADFGPGELVGIIFMPIIIAVFLVFYAKYARNKSWVC